VADTQIVGVQTNLSLLGSILRTPAFRGAQLSTRFLEDHAAQLAPAQPVPCAQDLALLGLWCQLQGAEAPCASPWADRGGWRPGGPSRSQWSFEGGEVVIETLAGAALRAQVGGESFELCGAALESGELRVQCGDRIRRAYVHAQGHALHLFEADRHVRAVRVLVEDSLESHKGDDQGSLVTPLPGTVVAVHVNPGEEVKRGTPLVTVEAMKMEHTLTAPHDGRITRVAQAVGDRVAEGVVLIEMA
ncbi:MAG: hypothetical protein JSS24_16095, partial [Proteobacteria bacterium]|nr:hypothetical protein [Pseudomonadota bacterium]